MVEDSAPAAVVAAVAAESSDDRALRGVWVFVEHLVFAGHNTRGQGGDPLAGQSDTRFALSLCSALRSPRHALRA